MHVKNYKQSKNAIFISYLSYRWFPASCTCGILAVYDWLNYRNTKLTFEENFIVFVTGALVSHSKEIPYEDIKSVRADQSILGKWKNYGTVNIIMKDEEDSISFRYVHNPGKVRRAIQNTYVRSSKLKMI